MYVFIYLLLLLLKYSCPNFPLTTPPHPTHPRLSPSNPPRLALSTSFIFMALIFFKVQSNCYTQCPSIWLYQIVSSRSLSLFGKNTAWVLLWQAQCSAQEAHDDKSDYSVTVVSAHFFTLKVLCCELINDLWGRGKKSLFCQWSKRNREFRERDGRKESWRDSERDRIQGTNTGWKMDGAMWKVWEGNEFYQQPMSLERDPNSKWELQPQTIPKLWPCYSPSR